MLNKIEEPVKSSEIWLDREGFIFTAHPNLGDKIFNIIKIVNVQHQESSFRKSTRSLDEHIKLINDYNIKEANILADDISFLKECPSLTRLSIRPSREYGEKFDYSPLYGRTIEKLYCVTDAQEGAPYKVKTSIEYSQINGLKEVFICGKGHNDFEQIDTLEKLRIRENKEHKNLKTISKSKELQKLNILLCSINTLDGIEQFCDLKSLSLEYCRGLSDISALEKIANSLEELNIENCAKIQDFSSLFCLKNLRHLGLRGSNSLANIQFLNEMDNLRVVNISNMNILDGDITPCLKSGCAYISPNRKHYNLKDSDLPKL